MKEILVLGLLGAFCFGSSVNAMENNSGIAIEQAASPIVKYTLCPGDSIKREIAMAPSVDKIKMDLSNNFIAELELKDIAEFSKWIDISEIDLSNCNLDDQKVEFLVCEITTKGRQWRDRKSHCRMLRLVLSGNNITDQGCTSLSRLVPFHVMSIVLDNNPGIGDIGARQLFATSLSTDSRMDWFYEPVVSFENCNNIDPELLQDIKDLKDALILLQASRKKLGLAETEACYRPWFEDPEEQAKDMKVYEKAVEAATAEVELNVYRMQRLINKKTAKYVSK